VRRQLERAEPERRQLPRRRRQADRRARARPAGGLIVKGLAVSGSLRADSYNTLLLEEAAAAAPAGVDVELFDASLIADLPAYDQDLDVTGDVPVSAERLREAWAE